MIDEGEFTKLQWSTMRMDEANPIKTIAVPDGGIIKEMVFRDIKKPIKIVFDPPLEVVGQKITFYVIENE